MAGIETSVADANILFNTNNSEEFLLSAIENVVLIFLCRKLSCNSSINIL